MRDDQETTKRAMSLRDAIFGEPPKSWFDNPVYLLSALAWVSLFALTWLFILDIAQIRDLLAWLFFLMVAISAMARGDKRDDDAP